MGKILTRASNLDSNLPAVVLITESGFCNGNGNNNGFSSGDEVRYGADEPIDLYDNSGGIPNDSRCGSVTDDSRIRCIMVA